MAFTIAPASQHDMPVVARLFDAYVEALGIDLGFQDFETERATLPGKYAPPNGIILLARDLQGEAIGCVALRPIPPEGCCEMKRLYVSPVARGLGLGRALVDAVIAEAQRIGYREMKLDTLPHMHAALSLYKETGFTSIDRYYDTPLADPVFLGRTLTA